MKYLFWLGVAGLVLSLSWIQSSKIERAAERALEEQYTTYEDTGPAIKGSAVTIVAPSTTQEKKATSHEKGKRDAERAGGKVIKIPIMIYHSVRPYYTGESRQQDLYDVTPELFESELALLKQRGFTTITFTDLHAHFTQQTPLPEKPIILSFDDGWKNQYLYAYPLLKKHNMRATFFIFSGAIGSRDAFMNWGEVIEMHRRGMDIQSHTYTHPILTKESAQTIARELTKSKKQIEEKIGAPVIALAYPFGLFNDEIVGEVARAHYGIARTTRDSVWHSSNRLLTIGGTLSTDNLSDFEALLSR